MWKVICVSCTLSRLAFLCRDCPSGYPGQHHRQAIRAQAKIEVVKNTTTLVMSYIWDFPCLSFDTHFSHHSSLRHWSEAENLYIFQQFLSFHQKPLIPNSNLQFSIFNPFSSQRPNHLNPIVPISSPLRIEDSVNSNLQFSIFSPFSSQSPNHLNPIIPILSPLQIEDGVKICKISHIWNCKPFNRKPQSKFFSLMEIVKNQMKHFIETTSS